MKKLLALALCALTLVFACAAAMADASITFQMGGEPECMDPTINDYSSGSYALQSLFRGLYKYDADGALVPAMAESYEVSEDGCTYTFKLKEGLKWSDGSPLTAHDFEYSWKRVLNPDVGSETAYTLYSVIKDGYECFVSKTVSADDLPIRALDDTTFQVELKAPASYFITLTASTAFMPVCKANVEKYGEDWSSSPETYVCNGPFMLADMKKDESFTFVKNPNYYNADEVKIDTVKYVFLNAPETVRMAFDNGELDIATSVNSDAMKAYTGTDKLVTSDRIGYRYYDTAEKEVQFPFGYGLSYTTFEYSDLELSSSNIKDTDDLTVTFKIKNTGDVDGAEIAEIYVADQESTIFRPKKELRAFKKVFLKAGEEKEVSVTLSKRAFAFYNVELQDWQVETGLFDIMVGASSRDIRLTKAVNIISDCTAAVPDYRKTAPAYYTADLAAMDDAQWTAVYGKELPARERDTTKPIDLYNCLDDASHTKWGGKICRLISKVVGKFGSAENGDGQMLAAMATQIPIRNFIAMSMGVFSPKMAEGLLMILNDDRSTFVGFNKILGGIGGALAKLPKLLKSI